MVRSRLAQIAMLALLACVAPPMAAQSTPFGPTTIVLVPAAEGISGARTSALMRALDHAEAAVVYTTDDRHAVETGRQLADAFGVGRIPYDRVGQLSDEFAGVLVANVVLANAGKVVLVVAERDVIVPFVRRVTGTKIIVGDEEFRDGLFIMTVTPQYASLVRAKL